MPKINRIAYNIEEFLAAPETFSGLDLQDKKITDKDCVMLGQH